MTAREEIIARRRELRVRSAEYLRTEDAATLCGVSRDAFDDHVRPFLTPRYLTPTIKLWRRADILAILEERTEKGSLF